MKRRARWASFALPACLVVLFVLPSSALAVPPLNDSYATAELITGSSAFVSGTNAEATKEIGEPNHGGYAGGRSVWYRWVAAQSGVVTLSTAGSFSNSIMAVYRGTTVDALTELARGTSVRLRVEAGDILHIAFDHGTSSTTTGPVSLGLNFGAPPANDRLADSQTLTLTNDAASVTGNNRWAWFDGGEPAHASQTAKASVWYSWTPTYTGTATIDTAGSGFDTTLAVYTGDTPAGLIPVASNDNASTTTTTTNTSRVAFRAIAGRTYRIAVDSRTATATSGTGDYLLNVRLRPPPINDDFAMATVLPAETTLTVSSNNDGASTQVGEPTHYLNTVPRASVWYAYTPPSAGTATIKTTANWSAITAVYTGDFDEGLTRTPYQAQSCTSCVPEQVRVRMEAGETYYIAVDSEAGVTGDFALTLNLIPRPANDDFASAAPIIGVSADITGSNVGATQEPCEPIHEENYRDPSVWFTWTAPATGGATIDMSGSDYDVVLSVYTGDTLCDLVRTPTTVLTGTTRVKRAFRATAGTTYKIAVDGNGATTGNYKLALRWTIAPLNDLFALAEPVLGDDVLVSGNNIGATGEPGEPTGTGGASVWYSWIPVADGKGQVTVTTPKDFSPTAAVYTGNTVDTLTAVPLTSGSFAVKAGTVYRILVHGGSTPNRGSFSLRVRRVASPANDHFANATVISGTSVRANGHNRDATRENGEPGYGDATVWYRWTATASGQVAIDTTGTFEHHTLGVYTGSSVNGLTTLRQVSHPARTVFPARAGETYHIQFTPESSDTGDIQFTLDQLPAPANDDFAAAATLTGSSVTVSGNNTGATRESGEPGHDGYASTSGTASVWYSWTAPESGDVTLDLAGSAIEPLLGVYTGTSVNSLTALSRGYANWATFYATEGTTYRIAIDGYHGDMDSFTLRLAQSAGPANDLFADATTIDPAGTSVQGTTAFAGRESGEPYAGTRTVWYRWVAPKDGRATFTPDGSTFVAAFTGSNVGALTTVASYNSSAVSFDAVAGRTYMIQVSNRYSGAGGTFSLGVSFAAAPPNDAFDDAETVSGASASLTGTTASASKQSGEPQLGAGTRTVWYRWVAPSNGRVTISTTGSGHTEWAAAYTGSSVGGLTAVSGAGASTIAFDASAGATYSIQVAPRYSDQQGQFTLSLSHAATTPPANDDFENAESISGASVSVTGTSTHATRQSGEATLASDNTRTVWYRWVAPSTGRVTLSATGTGHTTYVAAATGSSLGTLGMASSTSGSTVSFDVVSGTRYSFQVGPRNSWEHGQFTLSLNLAAHPSPPANDAFADAQVVTSGTISATNAGASRETEELSWNRRSVWYRWSGAEAKQLRVSLSHPNPSARVTVYAGTSLVELDDLRTSSGRITIDVRPDTTYYFGVAETDDTAGAPFTISVASSADGWPENDDIADAQQLYGRALSAWGTTLGATNESDEPSHAATADQGSVWYRWTAPETETVRFSVRRTQARVGFNVYTGTTKPTTVWGGSSAGGGEGGVTTNQLQVYAGSTYWISIANRDAGGSKHVMSIAPASAPANDLFVEAAPLGVPGDREEVASAALSTATSEYGEPLQHEFGSNHTRWWSWTADVDGTLRVTASEDGARVALYTGERFGDFTVHGRWSGRVTSALIKAGQRVYIAVERPKDIEPASDDLQITGELIPTPIEPQGPDPGDPGAGGQTDSQRPDSGEAPSEAGDRGELPPTTSGTLPAPPPPSGLVERLPKLKLMAAFPKQSIATVLKGGLTGTATCSRDCSLGAAIEFDSATAKRLGLKTASARVALASSSLRAGTTKSLKLKLPRSVQAKLKRTKVLRATIKLTAKSGGETLERSFKVTLKR